MEAGTNDLRSRPVLIGRQPQPQHSCHASTARSPDNKPHPRPHQAGATGQNRPHSTDEHSTAEHSTDRNRIQHSRIQSARTGPTPHAGGRAGHRNPNTSPTTPPGRCERREGYGGHSVGETPGPIPNPEAKPHSADGTAPARVWESRTPPDKPTPRAPHRRGALRHLNTPSPA